MRQLSELGLGKESDAIDTQSLKTAKLFLKGDFKVIVVVYKKGGYRVSRVILARVNKQNQILISSSLSSKHHFFSCF